MNNIEHFVHPGIFRDLEKGQGHARAGENRRSTGSGRFRAHLCCGWSYVMALREAEAAPHMELACELNDNDPWTLLSGAHYSALCGSIEQARSRAERALALSPPPAISNGLTTARFASSAATMPGPSRPAIARKVSTRSCRHGARHALFQLGERRNGAGGDSALRERAAFVLGWIVRSDGRSRGALGDASASDQRKGAMGNPAPTVCVAQGFLLRALFTCRETRPIRHNSLSCSRRYVRRAP